MRWSVSLSWLSWASSVGAPTQSEMVVLSADFIEKWAFYLKCHELLQRRHPKRLDQLQTRSYTACLHVKLNAKHYFIVWLTYFSMTINLIKPGSWLLIFNQISQNLYIPFLLFLHWRTHFNFVLSDIQQPPALLRISSMPFEWPQVPTANSYFSSFAFSSPSHFLNLLYWLWRPFTATPWPQASPWVFHLLWPWFFPCLTLNSISAVFPHNNLISHVC